ncbi:UNVERIFIED_CONTAM: hypothetical protein PYX00_004507 [Menopon gallinae]|uniref:Chloride channel CLIC-like protein 1 n=1 Tax=Menopon gallinae TaxID=328185 RepID=A0AAW2I5Z4_9NEOP
MRLKYLMVFFIVLESCRHSCGSSVHKEPEEKGNIDFTNMFSFVKHLKINQLFSSNEDEIPASPMDEPLIEHILSRTDHNIIVTRLEEYISRYVNLLLHISNLKGTELGGFGFYDETTVNLLFTIKKEDLIFLQNFSDNIHKFNIMTNLERIDHIISTGFTLKEDEREGIGDQILRLVSSLPDYLLLNLAVILSSIILIALKGGSKKLMLLLVINNCILLDGFINYHLKLKEIAMKEDEEYFKKMNEHDLEENGSWLSKLTGVWNSVTNNKLQKTETHKLLFIDSVLDSYGYYLLEKPLRIIGSASEAYTTAVNKDKFFPIRWILDTASHTLILFTISCFIVIGLFRPRIKFSFFGTGIEFGFPERTQERIGDEAQYERHRLQEISDSLRSIIQKVGTSFTALDSQKNKEPVENIRDSASELNSKESLPGNDVHSETGNLKSIENGKDGDISHGKGEKGSGSFEKEID